MSGTTVKMAKHPVFLLLALLASGMCGFFSFFPNPIFIGMLALVCAMFSLIFRAGRPWQTVLLSLPALGLTLLLNGSFWLAGAMAVSLFGGAALLVRGVNKNESRNSIAASLLALYGISFAVAYLAPAFLDMLVAGRQDVAVYFDERLHAWLEENAALLTEIYARLTEFYAEMKFSFISPSYEEIKEMLLFGISLVPGFFLLYFGVSAIAATYWLQLLGVMAGENAVYPASGRVYTISALAAGLYLFAMPLGFVWGDFRDALCFFCLNYAVFMTPVLAFGMLLQAPKLIGFMRRMSIGPIDFTFFLVLLIIFVFANFLYAILILAVIYAISRLKSTFFSRKKN